MELDPATVAPGCFGSALGFSAECPECISCAFFSECKPEAEACAEKLKSILKVKEIKTLRTRPLFKRPPPATMTVQPKPKPEPQPVPKTEEKIEVAPETVKEEALPSYPDGLLEGAATGLPKKSAQFVERIEKRGIKIAESLRAGKNPFVDKKPEFLWFVCKWLLEGGISKANMKSGFMTELKWQDGAASSHVSIAVPLLRHYGAVVERDGKFVIKES